MLGMMVAGMSQMIIGTALPTIVGELGGLNQLSWMITVTLLASTCATPLVGKLGDLYGRKRVFQASLVLFVVATILAGFSHTMTQLIVFRAAQGAAAGGLMALSQAILADIAPPRARGRYQGYMMSMWAVLSVGGPLIGGFFVDHLSWRWCFYFMVPFGIVALAVVQRVLHLAHDRYEHRIDYLGSALLVLTVSTLLLLTTWGGTRYAWTSGTTMQLAAVAIGGLVLFLVQESRSTEPVLPLRLFRNGTFSLTSAMGFLQGVVMFGVMTFMPVYLQVVTGMSATASGLQLLPLVGGMMSTSVWSGRRITRTGAYRTYPIVGAGIIVVSMLMLTRLTPSSQPAEALAAMVVMGIGLGLTMHVMLLAVQNAVGRRDLGVATSSSMFFRQMGGAIGTAVLGAVFNAGLATQLAGRVDASAIPGGDVSRLARSPAQIHALPLDVREPVIEAFGHALHGVFVVGVPIAIAGFALAWFLREEPLRDWDDEVQNPDTAARPSAADHPAS